MNATVIGVARSAKYFHANEPPLPFLCLPYAQNYASRMVLHLETEGPPAAAATAALAAVREIDPGQPVSEVRTLEDYFSRRALFGTRVALSVIAGVGLAGLALALAGLYGVVASAAARRRREIGIRVAVGASRTAMVTLVLRQHARLAVMGTTAGAALAVTMSHRLASLLVASMDSAGWRSLLLAMLAVAAASLVAGLFPAWRASGTDPAVALREE